MFWNKRVAILISALLAAAAATALAAYFNRPPLEAFDGAEGPSEISPVAEPEPADWTVHAEGTDSRLAILLTDDASSWIGLAEGLKSMGVPFRMTRDVDSAVRHDVIIVYPVISGKVLEADELASLGQHVEQGGTLIATQVLGGGLQGVFGFEGISESRAHSEIRFAGNDPSLSFINRAEERTVRIGNPDRDSQRIGTQAFEGARTILATYEDGSAALVANRHPSGGQAFALGMDLGFFILKATNGRSGGASRNYANAYEPSVDTWLRWLKSVYTQSQAGAVTLHPAPEGRDLAVIVSFDVDYSDSITKMEAYNDLLARMEIPGTFFVQTKYFDDYNDEAFFHDLTVPGVQRLTESGMEVASHSVAHSPTFGDMPLGDGKERYPHYQPRVLNRNRAWAASILGELRVSKFLLESVTGKEVVSFRPGYLATPHQLPEALEASGYKYASTMTSGNVLTHLPFRMNFGQGYEAQTDIFQFPIAIEDEIPPHMNLRVEPAIDLANELAEYGGSFVMLIHPNVTEGKLDFLETILPALQPRAWFGTLEAYGNWWTMRDGVAVDTRRTQDGWELSLTSRQPMRGLRLDIDPEWVPSGDLKDGLTFSPGQLHVDTAGTALTMTFSSDAQ